MVVSFKGFLKAWLPPALLGAATLSVFFASSFSFAMAAFICACMLSLGFVGSASVSVGLECFRATVVDFCSVPRTVFADLGPPIKTRPDIKSCFVITESTSISLPPTADVEPASKGRLRLARPNSRPEISSKVAYPPLTASTPSPSQVLFFLAVNFRLEYNRSDFLLPHLDVPAYHSTM